MRTFGAVRQIPVKVRQFGRPPLKHGDVSDLRRVLQKDLRNDGVSFDWAREGAGGG